MKSVLFILFVSAKIADANTFPILGAGTENCQEWLSDRKNANWLIDLQWIQGFLSAEAVFQAAQTHQTILYTGDVSAIPPWIDNYCRANDADNLEEAASSFFLKSDSFFRK